MVIYCGGDDAKNMFSIFSLLIFFGWCFKVGVVNMCKGSKFFCLLSTVILSAIYIFFYYYFSKSCLVKIYFTALCRASQDNLKIFFSFISLEIIMKKVFTYAECCKTHKHYRSLKDHVKKSCSYKLTELAPSLQEKKLSNTLVISVA